MSLRIRRFEAGDAPAVERLNDRLSRGGVTDRVWVEREDQPSEQRGAPISQELYVAVEGDEVRGGVWLHEHDFLHHGESLKAAWLTYPVAESLIDRSYAGIPGALIVTLMRRQPRLMALGMGSREAPLPRLLTKLGWTLHDVPFYAAAVRPRRVLLNLDRVAQLGTPGRIARMAARVGLADLANLPLGLLRASTTAVRSRNVQTEAVDRFGAWTDEIWSRNKHSYGFLARRDSAMLNQFYATYASGPTRLRVQKNGRDIGWLSLALSDGQSPDYSEYDGVRVGLLTDGLAAPEDAGVVLAAGVHHLVRNGADLLITNQIHRSWRRPLGMLGFVRVPSTFILGVARPVQELVKDELQAKSVFVNRGDCDGPPDW